MFRSMMALVALLATPAVMAPGLAVAAEAPRVVPAPLRDLPADGATTRSIVLSGGCFWGVQGVFQHVKGVTRAVSGYAGGTKATADYETVSSGETGHAESVQVTYDPRQVSYGTLLRVFFSVALDPTQVNRQGPDSGTQYRSEIFTTTAAEAEVAWAYIAQLDAAHVWSAPIATRVDRLPGFYAAEAYHQDYLTLHPEQPYIAFNDIPKVEALRALFPALYTPTPRLVAGS